MASSKKNLGVANDTNLDDVDGIYGGEKGNLFGFLDTAIDPVEAWVSFDGKNEGDDESKRPGSGCQQISAESNDLIGFNEASKEQKAASENVALEAKNQAVCVSHSPSHPSPVDREDARSWKAGAPVSLLSRDTRTLANLYHASRRSRHKSPKRMGNLAVIPSKTLSLRPTASSYPWDVRRIPHETSAIDNAEEDAPKWYDSCCSSNDSTSSAKSEEVMTGENDIGREEGVERQPKRQRTTRDE